MTVAELVEALRAMPQHLEVLTYTGNDGWYEAASLPTLKLAQNLELGGIGTLAYGECAVIDPRGG